MFGRPHRISPTCRVADVDHTFTKVCKNFTEPRPPDSPSTRTTSTTSTLRTGDGLSYSTNANVVLNIPANNARQMFRVLNCTEDRQGNRIFFDSIDGRIYGKGPAVNNRVSQDVVLYDSKSAALSERFPSNQVPLSPTYPTKSSMVIILVTVTVRLEVAEVVMGFMLAC